MTRAGAEEQGAYYRSRFSPVAGRDQAWRVICRHLQRYVPAEATVLDLGAGYCCFINHIVAAHKHALDAFDGVAAYAATGVSTHVGTCSDLSQFGDAQFDVVFASNLLEHLSRTDLTATLSEIRRVLRPDARLILIQPNYRYCAREYFDDYTHQFVFSHVSLADALAAHGFDVEVVKPRFLPLTFKSRLPSWPWLVNLYLSLPYRPLARQMLVVARRPAS